MRAYLNKILLVALLSFLGNIPLEAKILVFVPVYNRPDFIEWQHALFKKFLKDDYELMIFNDADNDLMEQTIEKTCTNLGITYIRMPQELHNVDPKTDRWCPGYRHGEVLQYAFDHYGYDHDDIVAVFDSDMFLIREWSIREFLGDCEINGSVVYGDPTSQITGVCVHFLMMNMPKLPDRRSFGFKSRAENGYQEVGADSVPYFNTHKNLKIKPSYSMTSVRGPESKLDPAFDLRPQLEERGYTPREIGLILSVRHAPVFCDIGFWETYLFLDYKHGSGWTGPSSQTVETKNRLVGNFIRNLLRE